MVAMSNKFVEINIDGEVFCISKEQKDVVLSSVKQMAKGVSEFKKSKETKKTSDKSEKKSPSTKSKAKLKTEGAVIEAYVDGSYRNGQVGWGACIVRDGELYGEFCGVVSEKDAAGTRQVAGELQAVIQVLFWCKEQGVDEITVYYDYKGIECWVTGEWKAKKEVTQHYRDYVQGAGIKIKWVKVKSHTGVYFNEVADRLASQMID